MSLETMLPNVFSSKIDRKYFFGNAANGTVGCKKIGKRKFS
jgi:hypothetical protein